jgi:C1A family cysteine protease
MRRFGYVRDVPDVRDQHFAKLGIGAAPPSSASLRSYVVEVLDQLGTSSCCANAWAQALRIADRVQGLQSAPQLSSREFLYYCARKYDGGAIVDAGTQLRSVAKAVVKFGRPPESAWPFVEAKINDQPPWEAVREAFDHRGPAGYHRISTLTEIKQAIAAGHAVVGGADIGESFENYTSGVYSPNPSEAKLGGHALCFVGYDEQSFTIVNSWGPLWGLDHGFIRVAPGFASTFTDLWCVSLK